MELADTRPCIESEEANLPAMVEQGMGSHQWYRRYAIPVSCPAAFPFYVNHLILPHSLRELLWAVISRKCPWLGRAVLHICRGKNAPSPLGKPQAGMTIQSLNNEGLHRQLRLHLQEANFEICGPLSLLTLNDPAKSRRGRTVAFLFDNSSQVPLAVAKLSTDPQQYASLKREHELLKKLACAFGAEANWRVPRPLAFFEVSPWTIVLESWVPGSTLYFEMRNSWDALHDAPKSLCLALKSLIAFQHAAGFRKKQMNHLALLEQVVQPLQAFAAHANPSSAELRLIERTMDLAQRHLGTQLITVASHGDFWAGNLVLDKCSIGIIDWEHYQPEALPFEDLFFFSTTYGLNYPWKLAHWAVSEAAFRATYLQATDIAHLVRDFLLSYCRVMGLATELLAVFFPVFLAKKALREVVPAPDGWQNLSPSEECGSGFESKPREMWRNYFRIYAECREPACFIDQPEGWR